MRLGFVQYGDYREAYLRLQDGGAESYYAQRYSVEAVEALSHRLSFVGVCSLQPDEPYHAALSDTLAAAGVPLLAGARMAERRICEVLDEWRITHLILRTPALRLLKWAFARNVAVLPLFADSWNNVYSPRRRFNLLRLQRLLSDDRVSVVANHNIPASLSLNRLGVPGEKIIPWDWPHALTPESYPVKSLLDGGAPHLVFVGAMTEAKGAFDCIEAARMLAVQGLAFTMTMIGSGEGLGQTRRRAEQYGLADRLSIPGKLPHPEVIAQLKRAALCFVLSRHTCAEGLPMTIYEALATRTPLIISDHPMFQLFLSNTPAVRMIPERKPCAAASAAASLLADPNAYARASESTGALWCRIGGSLEWRTLVETWLEDPGSAREKLKAYALPRRLETFQKQAAAP